MQPLLPAGIALLHLHKGQRRQVPFVLSGLLVQHHLLKLEHHGKLASVRRTVQFCPGDIGAPGLAHGDKTALLEGLDAEFPQKLMEPGAVVGDLAVRFLGDLIDHIQPEALHPLLHPPQDHVVNLPPQGRVLPVQVRLLGCKLVEVILPHLRDPLPGRAAKHRLHVVGEGIGGAVPPDVVVVAGIVPAGLSLQKPGVLVRAVVQHQIHHDADAPFFALPDQLPHILQAAEHGIDGPVVRDIVSVVHLGRSADRRQPDHIDAQSLQIVQPFDDSLQISHPASGGVLEALGIDLVGNGGFPPVFFGFVQHCGSSLPRCKPGSAGQYCLP